MKKVLSVLLCVFSFIVFCAFPFGMAFASSPVTWEDLGEDAIALRDSYFELWSSYGNGNFNQLFKSAADIPVNWFKILADGVLALSPVDDLFFTYEKAVPVVQSDDPKFQYFIDNGSLKPHTPVISSDDFKSFLSEDSDKYTLKNSAGKISYRNDKYYQTGLWQRVYSPTFFFAGEFNSVSSPDGFYCVPFFTDGTTRYIGEYQMHFYFSTEYDYTNKTAVKYLCLDLFKLADGSAAEPELRFKFTSDFDDFSYFYLIPVTSASPWWKFYGFSSLTDFYANKNYSLLTLANISNSYFKLISPDFSQTLDFYNVWNSSTYYFIQDYENHNKNCSLENDDIGFITSSSPLSTTYNFDINKISDGQLVTVTGGDTIYNYTILNPETGESSSVGDYITNNYTYITNNYGGEGEGSGVGGSVSVGGHIDVGGSVGVDINLNVPDININVNGNGGAGGSGTSISNPDDFTSVDEVDLTKYYDSAVEQSTGFQKFLKDFFGFLPAELLGMILFAVAMAIVCRVFGR